MGNRFLLRWAVRFRGDLVMIGALSLAGSLAALALPWLAARLAGGVIGEIDIDLGRTVAALAFALVSLAAMSIAVTILSEAATGRILAALRRETYDHVMALSIGFHDRHRHGDLLALISYEVGTLSTFLTATLAQMPAMLITAGGAVVALFLIDPVMALIVPVLVPMVYVGLKWLGRRLRVLGREVREAEIAVLEHAESDLATLPAVKAFAVEDERRRRYGAAIEEARRLRLRQTRITAFVGPTVGLIAALTAIGILLIGNQAIVAGTRTPSDLFAFLLYAALLTRPVGSLADTYGSYQVARGTLARLAEVSALAPEPGYSATGTIARAAGGIVFEAVDFTYPDRPPVLTGFSLTIAPGEIVALTGANGIGKSTLISLLLRFYDPDAGRILLDGTDIAALQVQNLRRQFGFVPQSPLLLNATIRENITFGMAQADPEGIARACRLAQAAEFIAELPLGLDTVIGDDGVQLSGGQRQRVALARALLRDPPIYIFDEATSMYDLEGEAAFVESCIEALAERTVIIVTHRPASLALANRVIDLHPGGYSVTERTGARGGLRG